MRYRYAFLDPTERTVVVACKACPHWSAVRLNRAEAYRVKADHDMRVHGVEEGRASHAGDEFDRISGVSQSIE